MLITPIKQDSLGQQVARELRHLIATRRIVPGTPVVEDQLASQFAVSRGPVRDALKMLAAEGLVTMQGGRAQIRGLTALDVDELFSLRQVLEVAAVTRAMALDPATLAAELKSALIEMRAAVAGQDISAFAAADLQFHSCFYLAAGHSRLAAIWVQYRPSVEMVLHASGATYVDLDPSIEHHDVLADLIRSGDSAAVVAELTEHIENARRRVRTFYETEGAAET